MVQVTPRTVFITMAIICTITLIPYYFYTPETLSKGIRESKIGPYGPPNADFDWCEYNYESFFYIAEPVNTFTGFLFVVQAIIFLQVHKHIPISYELLNCLLQICTTGLGTVLFHATLRYKMQLADELPMMAMVISGSCWLSREKFGYLPHKIAVGMFIPTAVVLWVTAEGRHTDQAVIHGVGRAILTFGFTGCFIHIFTRCSSMAKEDEIILLENQAKYGGTEAEMMPSNIFGPTFIIWMAGMVCWIIDVVLCELVQNLPFGIPYLHYHALWHLFVTIGLYLMMIIFLLHERLTVGGADVRMKLWFRYIPYLVETKQSIKSQGTDQSFNQLEIQDSIEITEDTDA